MLGLNSKTLYAVICVYLVVDAIDVLDTAEDMIDIDLDKNQ